MYFLGGMKEGTYFLPNTFRLLLLTDSSTSPAYVNSAMRLVVMEAAARFWFHLFRPSRRYSWKLSRFALVPKKKERT